MFCHPLLKLAHVKWCDQIVTPEVTTTSGSLLGENIVGAQHHKHPLNVTLLWCLGVRTTLILQSSLRVKLMQSTVDEMRAFACPRDGLFCLICSQMLQCVLDSAVQVFHVEITGDVAPLPTMYIDKSGIQQLLCLLWWKVEMVLAQKLKCFNGIILLLWCLEKK